MTLRKLTSYALLDRLKILYTGGKNFTTAKRSYQEINYGKTEIRAAGRYNRT